MKGRTKLERKGRGFRDRLLSLGIMAAVLVIAALVLIFKRDMDSVVLKDGAYNYFGDVKVEYTGKCRVQYTDKEVTIRDENGTQTLNSKPLYQPDGMALLPFDYAWYAGNDSVYRLSHFSTMAIENNSVVLRDGNLKAENAGGYLFGAFICCGEIREYTPVFRLCGRNEHGCPDRGIGAHSFLRERGCP